VTLLEVLITVGVAMLLAAIAPPVDPGIDEQYMFYPTRARMDPGSIWLRNIMLGIGREMERTTRKTA